jgi:hypothetical protein
MHAAIFSLQQAPSIFVCCVFNNRCLVVTSNGGRSPYSDFPNCPRASATSFEPQQLIRTELQQSSSSLTNCTALHCTTSTPPLNDLRLLHVTSLDRLELSKSDGLPSISSSRRQAP